MQQGIDLDVRTMPPAKRHATIFEELDALPAGGVLRLINDHDPKPLRYQLEAERPAEFGWEYEESGPERWVVQIIRQEAQA